MKPRNRVVVIVIAAALLFCAETTRAGPPPRTVLVGTANPLVDVPAVQAAVSLGGEVVLSGTFDFDGKRVLITTDVRIRGSEGATIRGGVYSFMSPLPSADQVPWPPPDIEITHLNFDGATVSPIHIAYASGVEVSHNTIRGVKSVPIPTPPLGMSLYHAGVIVGTYTSVADKTKVLPGAIVGRIRIHQNDIDMTSATPEPTVCQGVFVNRTWGAHVTVAHNVVSNCARNAIEILDNHLDDAGDGRIVIAGNELRSGVTGKPWPNAHRPIGIVAGWFFDPSGAIDPARNPPIRMEENRIEMTGDFATGIFSASNGAVLEENRVAVAGADALGIWVGGADGTLEENGVTGRGTYALVIAPFFPAVPAVVANRNFAACNRVSGFGASEADLRLGGDDNTIVGFTGSVRDDGSGNQFIAGDCDEDASPGLSPTSKE